MSLIRAIAGGYGPTDDFWYGPAGGSATISGIRVSPESSLSSSPLWAGVNIKSGVLASLPLLIYKRRPDGGKERAPYHAVYKLFHDAPNPMMDPFTFKKIMEVHRILWGNCYAEIRWNPVTHFVDSLWPLHPDGVRVEKMPSGDIRYLVRQPDGHEQPYSRGNIFHLPGLSLDGTSGLSLIQYARESIALNLSARNYSSSFMRQGGRPSGVLTHPGKLTKDGRANMRQEWEEIHAGAQNAHKIAILQEGVTWAQTGLSAEDAQLISLLEWSVEDISRFLNVPLHFLQQTTKTTSWGSGIEELSNGFVTYSLMPDLILWQQRVTQQLNVAVLGEWFAEFVVDALLRGKTLERYQAYQIASGSAPWLAPNEIRAAENRNPLPGGDELQKPADPPAPRPPAAPPSNQPKPPGALAETLARDTAARIVRRETAALERAGVRGWPGVVAELARDHAAFVAEALHIAQPAADEYVSELVSALLEGGPQAVAGVEVAVRVEALVNLALESQG